MHAERRQALSAGFRQQRRRFRQCGNRPGRFCGRRAGHPASKRQDALYQVAGRPFYGGHRRSPGSATAAVKNRQPGSSSRYTRPSPMANILYGVNGEGAGHSTRAKEVLTHLVSRGHRVHVASFDRGLQNLKSDFEATEIYGFRFAYVNNRVRYKRTIAKNLITVPQAAHSLHRLTALVDEAQIELVITDFDPLPCHIGHKRRLPVISIDNQHCLTNTVVSYPRKYRADATAAKLVTRLMTPHADAYLVISFFTAPIRKRNTFLFPPLLRQEI